MNKKQAKDWAQSKQDEPPDVRRLKSHIRKLEKKLQTYKADQGLIVEAVSEVLGDGLDLEFIPTPKTGRAKKRKEIMIIHISDTQVGKVTESYNTTVAAERLMLLADRAIKAARDRRQSATIDECRVYLGGDLIEGEEIFKGQVWEVDSGVFDQALKSVPEMLARMLLCLASDFKKVVVLGVIGNHGRNGPYGGNAHPKTNWDLVTMKTLEISMAKEKRIEFDITDNWYQVDNVLGWSNLIIHGHQVRGGFAGFPWYGVGRRAGGWKAAIREWESDGDKWNRYLWLGHFHTPAMATLNDVIMLANGTTESDNEFARSELAASGRPCQRVAFFTEAEGMVADLLVYLD